MDPKSPGDTQQFPQLPPLNQSQPSEQPQQPEVAPSPESPKKTHKLLFPILCFFLLLVLATLASGYFLYYLPRKNTAAKVASISKPVSDLKNSVGQTNSLLQDISNLSLGKTGTDTTTLKVSGLAIHPEIASLTQSTSVLGAKATSLGPYETAVSNFEKVITSLNPIRDKPNQKVAGETTVAESQSTIDSRKIKDDSASALKEIESANQNLKDINSQIASLSGISSRNRAKIEQEDFKDSAKNYFDQAGKIATYYNTLSTTTITMETKITSYTQEITTAANYIDLAISTANLNDAKDNISAAQINIQKAMQDTQDLEQLSKTLKALDSNSLPNASTNYQEHNLKVLSTVTDYFTSETTILKNVSASVNNAINIAQQRPLTESEQTSLALSWNTAISQEHLAQANFTADLTALVGEEITLATSFWQDNGILSLSSNVNNDIASYQNSLNELKNASQAPF